MKKRMLFFILIIISIFIIININFSLKKEKIIGKYANMNYANPHCCAEAPHQADTLILLSDGTFKSSFYGVGDYKFEDNELIIHYENGKAKLTTTISNKLFQNPKIIMNYKLNHYYEKIEEKKRKIKLWF